MSSLQDLQSLVNKAQAAHNRDDLWRTIEDTINELSNFCSEDRVRLRNVLCEHLNGLQAGSSDINVNKLVEYIRHHSDAGKKPCKPAMRGWHPPY